MGIFECRTIGRVMSAVLALAVFAGNAQAQVGSPPRVVQHAALTEAEHAEVLEMATPMENLVSQNPLDAAQSGGDARRGSRRAQPGSFGGATPSFGADPREVGLPQTTSAHTGRIERVGRRFGQMYADDFTDDSATTTSRRGRIQGRAPQAFGGGDVGGVGAIAPQNYGQGNANTIYQYSDYQQVPAPIYYAPYRQTGRYSFRAADGGWYSCTAALINQAILLTAGHCVHDGSGSDSGWNQDGYFYPAYSNRFASNDQRYGRCRTTYYVTTTDWYNTGTIGEGHDVAMALCGPLTGGAWPITRNRLPGEVLGYYGFCFRNCVSDYNFLTQLGYPANYHRGRQMTVSQHLEETALTGGADFLYGTGMRGGSSGGPHIQNIGYAWDHSADRGQNRRNNTIFAVTSWGYNDESIKLQGASPISGVNNDNNPRRMFNMVCARSRAAFGNSSCRFL